MIELTDIPNVKIRLDNDTYFMKDYGKQILEVVNATYNYLVNETKMCTYLACELNSMENLTDMFDEFVDDFILNYATEETFPIYNVMVETGTNYAEPIPFCKLWRKDLFDYMLRTYR